MFSLIATQNVDLSTQRVLWETFRSTQCVKQVHICRCSKRNVCTCGDLHDLADFDEVYDEIRVRFEGWRDEQEEILVVAELRVSHDRIPTDIYILLLASKSIIALLSVIPDRIMLGIFCHHANVASKLGK